MVTLHYCEVKYINLRGGGFRGHIKHKQAKWKECHVGHFYHFTTLMKTCVTQSDVHPLWLSLSWNIWEIILSKCEFPAANRMRRVCRYFNQKIKDNKSGKTSINFDIRKMKNDFKRKCTLSDLQMRKKWFSDYASPRCKKTRNKLAQSTMGGSLRTCSFSTTDKLGGVKDKRSYFCIWAQSRKISFWLFSPPTGLEKMSMVPWKRKPIISAKLFQNFEWRPE